MIELMLDAGHGYITPGKRSLDGSLHEWSFNSVVAQYVADLLAQYENVTTYFAHDLTGKTDVPLQARTDNANRLKVDAYISFHANAGAITARGLETYIYPNCPNRTVALGMAIHKSLIPTTGMQDRGLKRANFHVLRETKMDAVLIEHGFMTNDQDLRLLKDDGFRHKCAEGTVKALVSFYGLKKKVSPPYKVIIPNTAFWQARNLVIEYQQRGFKCYGKNLKLYAAGQDPADGDPYQLIIETDLETAKEFVIELQMRGYDRTYGEEIK